MIHSVDNCKREFQYKFDSSIRSIQYAPIGGNHILVILADSRIQFVNSSGEVVPCPGVFGCAQWANTCPAFFAATEKALLEISYPSLETIHEWSFDDPKMKPVVSMTPSPNDHFIALLDSGGAGRCFSLIAHTVVARYTDRVNRVRFAYAVFDRNSEYVIIAPKIVAMETLRVYTVEPGNQVRTLTGPKEPILRLFSHPLDAVVYGCCKGGLFVWDTSTRSRMRNSVPVLGLKRGNWVFEEPEDFFDNVPQRRKEDSPQINPVKLSPDLLKPADSGLLIDDKDYPDQLVVLSWKPQIEE
jgi:WD40 repeat protein